jgi:hypothetical protein
MYVISGIGIRKSLISIDDYSIYKSNLYSGYLWIEFYSKNND